MRYKPHNTLPCGGVQIFDLVNDTYATAFQIFDLGNATAKAYIGTSSGELRS